VDLRNLLRQLSGQGKAILISSHILSDLEDTCTHVGIMDRGRLVRYGTVNEVRRGVFATLRYRVGLLGDHTAAVPAAVAAGARNAEIQDGALFLDALDEEHVARINAGLVAAGLRVAELRKVSNLEDAFLKITAAGEVSHDVR
jgi:ABC-2 type transport system ATP-binding protein